jgi:hypothetical protein
MKRIATRTFTLLASGLFALGMAAACASEDTTGSPFKQALDAGKPKPDAAHLCNLAYCPMPATGNKCCLPMTGACGVDEGNGCVPAKKDSGP